MSLQRRRLLQVLSYAFGASVILPRNAFALAAQKPAERGRNGLAARGRADRVQPVSRDNEIFRGC